MSQGVKVITREPTKASNLGSEELTGTWMTVKLGWDPPKPKLSTYV